MITSYKRNENFYHNTTKELGKQLTVSNAKAYSQAEAIMAIFFDSNFPNMTPAEVWVIYCKEYKEAPISSIQARITTLTNRYQLVKTDEMRMGKYGKLVHCWRLAKEEDKQIPLL